MIVVSKTIPIELDAQKEKNQFLSEFIQKTIKNEVYECKKSIDGHLRDMPYALGWKLIIIKMLP